MIFSAQDEFSNKQAVTASAASTNYIDLLATGTPYGAAAALNRDLGKGKLIPLFIQVTTAFATLTSLKVAVQTDDNTSFSSATTVLETEAIPVASLVAGYQFNIQNIPLATTERYVRLYYTVAGSSATAGNIQAGVTMGNQQAPI
jgi:hypothetical protein